MNIKPKNKVIIGVALLLLAAMIYLYTTPAGGFLPEIKPDGKSVTCTVTFDKDSINAKQCNEGSTCRTGSFGSFGLFDTPTSLKLLVGQRTYASTTYDANMFGVDQTQTMQACVPGGVNTFTIQLTNDQSELLDKTEVNIQ